jgi:hypothetical protein
MLKSLGVSAVNPATGTAQQRIVNNTTVFTMLLGARQQLVPGTCYCIVVFKLQISGNMLSMHLSACRVYVRVLACYVMRAA